VGLASFSPGIASGCTFNFKLITCRPSINYRPFVTGEAGAVSVPPVALPSPRHCGSSGGQYQASQRGPDVSTVGSTPGWLVALLT
jgi:hypothetical protein